MATFSEFYKKKYGKSSSDKKLEETSAVPKKSDTKRKSEKAINKKKPRNKGVKK